MELARRTFHASRGWASPLPVDLDGPQTLVLAFGASGLGAAPLARALKVRQPDSPPDAHAGASADAV